MSESTVVRSSRVPRHHRTVNRVTRILELVASHPGLTASQLARALQAPKSSVHGFIDGLLANGWLHEQQRRLFVGPVVYGFTLARGQIRAGLVTHADLAALHEETGLAVFLGARAGDHLVDIGHAGPDTLRDLEPWSTIGRRLLATAGGKALVAAQSEPEREAYLRRYRADEPDEVEAFLAQLNEIRRTRIATEVRPGGPLYVIATTVRGRSGEAVAAITLVGRTADVQPRKEDLAKLLVRQVDAWSQRRAPSVDPRSSSDRRSRRAA